jgi:hypothetical protein
LHPQHQLNLRDPLHQRHQLNLQHRLLRLHRWHPLGRR